MCCTLPWQFELRLEAAIGSGSGRALLAAGGPPSSCGREQLEGLEPWPQIRLLMLWLVPRHTPVLWFQFCRICQCPAGGSSGMLSTSFQPWGVQNVPIQVRLWSSLVVHVDRCEPRLGAGLRWS
jgi:hypothetical protein